MSDRVGHLCRFPDENGEYHKRCWKIYRSADKDTKGRGIIRQCYRAASKDSRYCNGHRR